MRGDLLHPRGRPADTGRTGPQTPPLTAVTDRPSPSAPAPEGPPAESSDASGARPGPEARTGAASARPTAAAPTRVGRKALPFRPPGLLVQAAAPFLLLNKQ